MASTKEIVCPHCKKASPFGVGFDHDADLNFICGHCRKVMFAVTEAAEAELKKVATGATYSRLVHLPIGMGSPEEETKDCPPIEDELEYGCYC